MENKTAFLYSKQEPSEKQYCGFRDFLKKKYHTDIAVRWVESQDIIGGFRLEIGSDVYDWTVDGRFRQLKNTLSSLTDPKGNVIPLLKETIHNWVPKIYSEEIGTVSTLGDGIATVTGLEHATYGEILMFDHGVRGMVQDLRPQEIGCILFDTDAEIVSGSRVTRTGKTAGVPVGKEFIGRVVDPLGSPIDGEGAIQAETYMPIETPAPGIIDRQPVDTAMETGLLAIDAMFPIGRGQRELIIGDRQTGKTAIALDTILNQKGKDVICIYVAIGQKASSVAQIVQTLKKHGAMEYTAIVCATASDSAPLQYIAPYAGCAMGEYFMHQGKDVLIVYDDLSKHALAYRSLSLLLERAPGREAYPGDVFYLHSRLLERSAHLSKELGGGSLTALPIVETQAGDVSAYIPTNIISITDGQIFLESDLFFAGQRPAVNVGLSVSRVGGAAQTKAMKKASGAIRLDLAQYREMEVFMQFASDLDDATKRSLSYGQGLMEILKQPQYNPYKQYQQVILLTAALDHAFETIPKEKVKDAAAYVLARSEKTYPEICSRIESDGILTDEDQSAIQNAAKKFVADFEQKA